MKKVISFLLILAMLLSATSCGAAKKIGEGFTGQFQENGEETEASSEEESAAEVSEPSESSEESSEEPEPETDPKENLIALLGSYQMKRPGFFESLNSQALDLQKPSVKAYTLSSDLHEVVNLDQFYLGDKEIAALAENQFYVSRGWNKEFFEQYETNRYGLIPNFVTVDSLMHTYHLYFAYLLKKIEKGQLSERIADLSAAMLETAEGQLEELKGTEWEEAARRNVAYFAIGCSLIGAETEPSADIKDIVSDELEKIYAEAGISDCTVSGTYLDYSQFRPRGYYEGDEQLEAYFRTMMWYGQIGFKEKEEDMNRSALLMTLAMRDGDFADWEAVYVVTSFFAGASDDLSYYEFLPAIQASYGENAQVADLVGNTQGWEDFKTLTAEMDPPAINSIPTMDDFDPETKTTDENKGFRFMGQRFTIDASIFQQLVYDEVTANPQGDERRLPDTLDIPAALGSETAAEILRENGAFDFEGYEEKLTEIRAALQASDDTLWGASLYATWLNTLRPLLEVKGEGYPQFMQSEAWLKKDLETFAGSFTELKHDTVLYAKQMMAEMGGGPLDPVDDRGYVEPETAVYDRFVQLTQATIDGLDGYGLLSSEDKENLEILLDLASQLKTISEKELREETLTDDEYELIRTYGGNLEHLWIQTVRTGDERVSSADFPSALVTDIATDADGGRILEIGTGNPSNILVIAPVDGQLKLCRGTVYEFYQFTTDIGNRYTDTTWRQQLGIELTDEGVYNYDLKPDQPEWTQSYRVSE